MSLFTKDILGSNSFDIFMQRSICCSRCCEYFIANKGEDRICTVIGSCRFFGLEDLITGKMTSGVKLSADPKELKKVKQQSKGTAWNHGCVSTFGSPRRSTLSQHVGRQSNPKSYIKMSQGIRQRQKERTVWKPLHPSPTVSTMNRSTLV